MYTAKNCKKATTPYNYQLSLRRGKGERSKQAKNNKRQASKAQEPRLTRLHEGDIKVQVDLSKLKSKSQNRFKN